MRAPFPPDQAMAPGRMPLDTEPGKVGPRVRPDPNRTTRSFSLLDRGLQLRS